MSKKYKNFEGFWVIKPLLNTWFKKLPKDYDALKTIKFKEPVPRSHFFKIEKLNSKSYKIFNKDKIKICTWNIFYGKYINDIIKEIQNNSEFKDVDVFLFQEMPRNNKLSKNPAKELAKKLGFSYAYGVLVVSVNKNGKYIQDYGNAIISRYPIESSNIVRLKNVLGRWDFNLGDKHFGNRMALHAEISTPIGKLDIFNVHFDTLVLQNKRKEQVEKFLNDIKSIKTSNKEIIAGDFNTFQLKEKKVRKAFETEGYSNVFGKKFNITHNFIIPFHLDHIYTKGLKLIKHKVMKNMKYSDHYPIIAELK